MPTEAPENWVDISWMEAYLTAQISLPSHWLFIQDSSCIFPRVHAMELFDRKYEVIFFDSDLQVRRKLESYKDSRETFCACIVSSQPREVNLQVLDYIARSHTVEITPRSVLEFAQPGYTWTNSVNQLKGEDFWALFERLQRCRLNYPRALTSADATDLLLAARLELAAPMNLSAREATDIWQRMESDSALIAWGERYPKLFQSLNLKVRTAIPLMEKLKGDEDFVCFLWTSYVLAQHNEHYDLFLPRIFGEAIWKKYGHTPTDEIWDACHQLIRNDPHRVIDQVKRTEIWLTQDGQRLELFQKWVGVDASNPSKLIQYAKRESLFCVPMREALRFLAAQLCHSPDSLPTVDQLDIVGNIQQRHLFLRDEANYIRIKDTFRTFATLVELNQLIGDVENRRWLDAANRNEDTHPEADVWRKKAYPVYLSKLESMADGLEQLNFQCGLLPRTVIGQVLNRAHTLMGVCNAEFAQLIASTYPSWRSADRDQPSFTVDFLDLLFVPRYQRYVHDTAQAAYIFVFDGMRWDTWESIKPKVLGAFQGKFALEGVFPLASVLPTTTAYNKYALLTGGLPRPGSAGNWWGALAAAFQERGIDGVEWVSDKGDNQTQILDLIETDEVPVKIFNFTFIDQKLHYATQNLSTTYEEIKVNFDLLLQPYLERIPADSLIFLLSDHGFIETTDCQEVPDDRFQALPISETHQRYIGLSSYAARPDLTDLIFFSANEIGLPPHDTLHYGFATARIQLLPSADAQRQNDNSNPKVVRYAHGGISMQEMIVPCAVFVPTAKGQLEIFPST